jgi:5-methylcytosine-specific restriction endonuclease McrA
MCSAFSRAAIADSVRPSPISLRRSSATSSSLAAAFALAASTKTAARYHRETTAEAPAETPATSARQLAREPYCRACAEDGKRRRAVIADHVLTIAEPPELRLDPKNLRSLGVPCHNAKSNRFVGGFGRPRVRHEL